MVVWEYQWMKERGTKRERERERTIKGDISIFSKPKQRPATTSFTSFLFWGFFQFLGLQKRNRKIVGQNCNWSKIKFSEWVRCRCRCCCRCCPCRRYRCCRGRYWRCRCHCRRCWHRRRSVADNQLLHKTSEQLDIVSFALPTFIDFKEVFESNNLFLSSSAAVGSSVGQASKIDSEGSGLDSHLRMFSHF